MYSVDDDMLLGGYEVMLDKYKLKTPMGQVFRVHSEALAIAVATEWDSQHEFIKKPTMYLVSSYCSVCFSVATKLLLLSYHY